MLLKSVCACAGNTVGCKCCIEFAPSTHFALMYWKRFSGTVFVNSILSVHWSCVLRCFRKYCTILNKRITKDIIFASFFRGRPVPPKFYQGIWGRQQSLIMSVIHPGSSIVFDTSNLQHDDDEDEIRQEEMRQQQEVCLHNLVAF